ncbi:alpha/beta hydrolase [Devosia sp. MC532]|uniref:alpha/beta hydrolase n=1 Tax=Devosia sp. MC532 TaxID=2799788 RepID=UPI0020BDD096|nr:alpha/beta hydrolase [Devosia sp. MC532]
MSILKRAVMALAVCASLMPMQASAQNIMDPFNLPPVMDANAVKAGDGISYRDGTRHKLDVYTPEQRGQLAPVVFFVYGGAWVRGQRADYQFAGRALAARGFVVVIADYRLVPEVRYPEFLEDLALAMRWTQDNITSYGGDPNRLFLAGHSAGAYNAVMLALDPSFRNEAGVTMPIRAVAGLSGPYDFYPFEYGDVVEAFGQAPNPEGTQPINLVTHDSPPMWLGSGTTDPIVRVQNTQRLAERLQNQGVWVTTKYYDGYGHMEPVIAMGAMWRWRMPVLDDMISFFTQFGAFPSGVPYVAVTPDAPQEVPEGTMATQDVVRQLDRLFGPLSN